MKTITTLEITQMIVRYSRESNKQLLDELEKWVIDFGRKNIGKRCSFCLGAVLKEINSMREKK